jgi:iron complex outermembrane receptor protein
MNRAARPALSLLAAALASSSFASQSPRSSQGDAEDEPPSQPTAQGSQSPRSEDKPEVPQIVITATRTPRPLRDVPAAVTVLPRSEIERSPTQTVDELLRTIPSFATFRRTNSVASDPTAQGLNLRGVGPSGVSRTLVLLDGLPANDPFGGWFYWRSIPRLGIEQIEVVPGGGSALYGNYALGGVIQIVSRPIGRTELEADGAAGLPRQAWAAARAAGRLGGFASALESEVFSTAGYPVVASAARGPIDRDAPSDHQTINARLEFQASQDFTLFARGGYFAEGQNGGTQYTTSSVQSGHYAAGSRLIGGRLGALELSFFGHAQSLKQNRARVSADRSTEALAASQDVPTDDQGLAVVWTSPSIAWAGVHRASAGLELRRIHGSFREDDFPAVPTPTSIVHREAGGEQRFVGAFLQDSYEPFPALELIGALRFDAWRNLNASQLTIDQTQVVTSASLQDRRDSRLSPKLGARYRALDWLTIRGSAYGAFRAPTLNELYRPFQVGTILTAANDGLGPETLRGGEAGFEIAPSSGWTFRATGFWNQLRDPIANVTLAAPLPDGSQRQRQNAGQARIRGVEVDAGWRFARAWIASAAYTFVDSALTQFPDNPQLVGKQLAQDPAHRGTILLTFEDPRLFTATLLTRVVGPQFEDDQNQLAMAGFLIVDLSASRRVIGELEVYAAVENLFNRVYLVGRAGVDTVGQPFTLRAGLRLHIGR